MWRTWSKPSKTPTSILRSPVKIRNEYPLNYSNPPNLQDFLFCFDIHTKMSGCQHQNLPHCTWICAKLVRHPKRMPRVLARDMTVTCKNFHPTLVLLYANLSICHMKGHPLILVLTPRCHCHIAEMSAHPYIVVNLTNVPRSETHVKLSVCLLLCMSCSSCKYFRLRSSWYILRIASACRLASSSSDRTSLASARTGLR